MSNNKQTSVEWQYNELMMINFQYVTNRITPGYFQEQLEKIKEQAKAMHKEEIERAHYDGSVIVISKPDHDMLQLSQQYYNETFGE